MKRVPIDINEMAPWILSQLPKGVLLTSAADGKVNTMTIGWGTLGADWGLPVFCAFVRQSRFTKTLIDKSKVFTVNIPLPQENAAKILGYCGTKSGRHEDKFEALGLTVWPGEKVSAPAIVQLPVTLECEVVYQQDQNLNALDLTLRERWYPQDDFHTMYAGKIVAAYRLEEE